MSGLYFSIDFKSQFKQRTAMFYNNVLMQFCKSRMTVANVPFEFYMLIQHMDIVPVAWNDSNVFWCTTISGNVEDDSCICPLKEIVIDVLIGVLKEISKNYHLIITFKFEHEDPDIICSTDKEDDGGECTFRLEKVIQEFDVKEELKTMSSHYHS